ncbi:MAG: hypothetical protein M9938_01600 [Solirubrobacterales bacterium]|nr:hypothetical protein [Solirubrobacterales bacterium]
MKNLARIIILVSSAAILGVVVWSGSAGAGKPEYGRTVVFNMYPTPEVKPDRYFLTANAGPYLKNLRWKGWGRYKTVGKGRFISDCASCGPRENKPVRITFFRRKPCHRSKVMIYSRVKIKVIDRQRPNRVLEAPMACF